MEEINYNTMTEKLWDELYTSINEMAINRSKFKTNCINYKTLILFNLVNIIILGNYSLFHNFVYHWQTELMNLINKLYNCICEKSVKKDEIIYDNIIRDVVDPDTWKWDDVEIIEKALKDEIRKGSNNPKYKNEVNFIKYNIFPNVEIEMELHANTFAELFKALVIAFKKKDISIFTKTLNKYTI